MAVPLLTRSSVRLVWKGYVDGGGKRSGWEGRWEMSQVMWCRLGPPWVNVLGLIGVAVGDHVKMICSESIREAIIK